MNTVSKKLNLKTVTGKLMALGLWMQFFTCSVFAEPTTKNANTDAVVAPIKNLTTLMEAIVAAGGTFVVVYNIPSLAMAIQERDKASIWPALMGIISGAIMALVSTILLILGIK